MDSEFKVNRPAHKTGNEDLPYTLILSRGPARTEQMYTVANDATRQQAKCPGSWGTAQKLLISGAVLRSCGLNVRLVQNVEPST